MFFYTYAVLLLFFRNNLTVLDVVLVQGQGASGELMIDGRRPGVDSEILFELKQKHLEECTSKTSSVFFKFNNIECNVFHAMTIHINNHKPQLRNFFEAQLYAFVLYAIASLACLQLFHHAILMF